MKDLRAGSPSPFRSGARWLLPWGLLILASCAPGSPTLELADLRNLVNRALSDEIDKEAPGYLQEAKKDLHMAEKAHESGKVERSRHLSTMGIINYRIAEHLYERARLRGELAQLHQRIERGRSEILQLRSNRGVDTTALKERIARVNFYGEQQEYRILREMEEIQTMISLARVLRGPSLDSQAVEKAQGGLEQARKALKSRDLGQALEELGRGKEAIKGLSEVTPKNNAASRALERRLHSLLRKTGLGPVNNSPRGVTIVVRGLFSERGPRLAQGSKKKLLRLARAIREMDDQALLVEAHLDRVGKPEENLTLSKKQAQVIARTLSKAGVSRQKIVATGQGDHLPIADNSSEEGRSQNRRVEITLLFLPQRLSRNKSPSFQ